MFEHFQEGYTAIELDVKKEVVILLGNIGTGKSTFSKYLRAIPMDTKKNSAQRWIYTDNENKIRSEISDTPKTIIPNVDVVKQTGQQVIDCAGFENNISIEMDLLAGFFKKKIFDSCKKVKIVIVEDVSNLRKKADVGPLIQALTRTANLIGDNLKSFEGSVGLIASKLYCDEDDKKVLKEIEDFLVHTQTHLEETQAIAKKNDDQDTLEYLNRTMGLLQLIIHDKKVQLFTSPRYLRIPAQRNQETLQNLVFKTLTPTKTVANEFKVTMTAQTENYIKKKMLENTKETTITALLKKLEESTDGYLKPVARKSSIQFYKDYLNNVEEVDSLEQLTFLTKRKSAKEMELHDIRFQIYQLKFLLQAVGKQNCDFEKNAISDLKTSLVTKVNMEINFYLFLELFTQDFGMHEVQHFGLQIDEEIATLEEENFKRFTEKLRGWKFSDKTVLSAFALSPSEPHVQALKQVFQMEQSKVDVSSSLFGDKSTTETISGRFVHISRIKEKIMEAVDIGFDEIVVIAAEMLFIDEYLTLPRTHLKLIAPVVQVVGNVIITLTGLDGQEYLGAAANCKQETAEVSRGDDGQAGVSSGNFILMALDLQNSHLLSVQSYGGNGGVGQIGGDGCLHSPAGGQGGAGGFGSSPGKQQFIVKNQEAVRMVETISKSGSNGASGQDGRPGNEVVKCMLYFLSLMGPTKGDPPSYNTDDEFNKKCREYPGANGVRHISPYLPLKNDEMELFKQVFEYHNVVSRMNLLLQADTSTGQFLSFLCTSDQLVSQTTSQEFQQVIEDAETNIESSEQSDLQNMSLRMHFFYSSMLHSVRRWRQINANDTSEMLAEDAEVTLISLLDSLQSFLRGKQLVELSAIVKQQLIRLSDVDKVIEQVGKFDAVASQKQFALSKIAEAEKLMHKVSLKNIADDTEKANVEFTNLLQKTEIYQKRYEETDEVMINHRAEVNENLVMNIALRIANLISVGLGLLCQPLTLWVPILTELVPDAKLMYNHAYLESVKIANKTFAHVQEHTTSQQQNLIDIARRIINDDKKFGFLKESNREQIGKILKDAENNRDSSIVKQTSLFIPVIKDLKERSAAVKDFRTREILTATASRLKKSLLLVSSGMELYKIVQRYKDDKSMVNQVVAAIEDNKVIVEDMETYEETVQHYMKPLLDQMVEFFDSAQSSVNTQNDFELLLQQLDLKGFARKCILIVQKLTQYFLEKDERLTRIFIDQQALLTTIIDAFDTIEELRYREPLAEYFEKLSGVNCINGSVLEVFNDRHELAQKIITNELVREFTNVYAAYHLASFPFGASKEVDLINANEHHFSLFSKPKERVVELLRSSLETIRDDLSNSRTADQDDRDTEVLLAQFIRSKKSSTRPFFVWPNAKYSRTIAKLLSGEQVTLLASVDEPGVRNAAKFNCVALNLFSTDEDTTRQLNELLKNFQIEMVRTGESCSRCGDSFYAVGDAPLNFTISIERDEHGVVVLGNSVHNKVCKGDVPLSPYGVWKFRLVPDGNQYDLSDSFSKLAALSKKVDLELIGEGTYIADGAGICDADLSNIYTKCSA
jgi:hypothetical protein